MVLEQRTYKAKELAEWFNIKLDTFYHNKAKKLQELKHYCEFQDLGKKGVKIIDVYIPEYIKAPSARTTAEKYFDEGWNSNGYNLNTCKRTTDYINNNHEDEVKVQLSTLYNAVCLTKNKYYGSCLKSSKHQVGERGTSHFVLCLIDKNTGKFRPFTEEEQKIKRDIYAKHFKNYQDQLLEELVIIQHIYESGIITQLQYEQELSNLSLNNYKVNWDTIKREIRAATGCECVISTEIAPCAFPIIPEEK